MATSGTSNQHSPSYPTAATSVAGQAYVWVTSNASSRTYTVHITASMGIYRNASAWYGAAGCGSGTATVYIDGASVGTFDTWFTESASYTAYAYTWTRPNIGTWEKTFNYGDDGKGRDITAYIDFPYSVYDGTLNMPDPSVTVHPDDIYSKPALPTVSVSSKTDTSVAFSVAVSNYGNPASANNRYIEAELSSVAKYDSGDDSKRRYTKAFNVSSATITVSNSSYSGGTLNIASNTKYYYGAYANNTQLENHTPDATMANNTVITLPSAPTASNFTVVDAGAASFKVTDASSGSAASVQLQYRYKPANGSFTSWTNAGATGNKQTRTVSLTGLDSNTAYTVEVRATTSAGTSTTSSYASAFTTSKVTVSITSQTDAVSSTEGKVNRTMKFSFGALSTSGTVYQYEYQYKKSSTSTWGTAVTGTSSATTKDITITLDQGTTYNFRVRARISGGIDESYGDYATVQFTTTSYQPGVPVISYRFDDIRSKVYVDITPNGLVSSVTCKVSGGSPSFDLINSTKSTTGSMVTFEANLLRSSQVITPIDVANFTITATQKYSSNVSTATANMPTPWRIVGVITKPNGDKMNIIRVRIKDKNGTLTAGDPKHPFVTK